MKKEKIVLQQKCDRCRCKNSMTEKEVLFRMRTAGERCYVFWCHGCREDIFIHKEQLPQKVVKKLEKRFKK